LLYRGQVVLPQRRRRPRSRRTPLAAT